MGELFEFTSDDRWALRWAFDQEIMEWTDQLHGLQTANPLSQLGDFVIGRSNGQPSYQLAVVVDDHDMAVTEVVRGDDLILSTYRQLAIIRHLQWPCPNYYHVPLIHGPDGQRLAKRLGDSITHLRSQGISSEAVIGFLAYTAGLIARPENLRAQDLIPQFNWKKLPLAAYTLPNNVNY